MSDPRNGKGSAAVAVNHLAMELYLRRELRRHYLSERERLVADALIEVTLGWKLDAVLIPKLEVISQLTGLARPHVHNALKGLFDMKILKIDSKDGIARYAFNPNSDAWKVKIRTAAATVQAGKDLLQEINHLHKEPDALVRMAKILVATNEQKERRSNFTNRNKPSFYAPPVTDSVTVTAERFPELS